MSSGSRYRKYMILYGMSLRLVCGDGKISYLSRGRESGAANCALWVLKTVLGNALKLLHPFMPFITEEIYGALVPEEESLMMSSWPVYKDEWNFPADETAVEHIKDITRGIRNMRAEMNVPNNRRTKYLSSVKMQSCLPVWMR